MKIRITGVFVLVACIMISVPVVSNEYTILANDDILMSSDLDE